MTMITADPKDVPHVGQFAFTPENLAKVQELISHYPPGRQASAVIAVLDLAQRQQGWLPRVAMDAVLGQTLTEATVRDQSILGAATMTAAEADYELLGSGETPFSEVKGVLIGTLDVADAESEALHAYELGDARSHWCVAKVGFTPDDRRLADGGRIERVRDHFQVGVTSPVTLVMRVSSQSALEVWANGKKLGLASIIAQGEGFDERAIAVPPGTEDVVVRPTEPVRFASFHYWWFAD